MEQKTIYSPGKLLITSEYVVLDGALALAVPTKLGQTFSWVELEDHESTIIWHANHENQPWLYIKINYRNWEIIETNLPNAALFVVKVLKNVQQLSETKFKKNTSYIITTNLEFPGNFGLGSSSTLMNNLAEFSSVDAFLLNELSLGGSGYDIAVAQEQLPILYKNNPRSIQKINFNPPFADELILIHLNQKKDSRDAIQHYKKYIKTSSEIDYFSELTQQAVQVNTLDEFSTIMQHHENELSKILHLETVKAELFSTYGGFVKSLGGWGGDFVLASKSGNYERYFNERNFKTIFNWKDIIC